jgi:hypothetical protein
MALVSAPLFALALAASVPLTPPLQAPIAVAAAAVATTPARLPATVNGVVLDALSGQPMPGALVQQVGSITSIFTGSDGHFRLLLERQGSAELTVSAMGYEDQKVAVGTGKDLTVSLREISGFLPAVPLATLVPVGMSAAETAPLNSGLMFTYSLRNNLITAPGTSGAPASITGWSNNDFRLGMRFRWKPWLAEAEGDHFETPVDLVGLRKEDNPAFKPSTWQAGARVGRLWSLTPDFEVAALGAYRWTDTVPNNSRVPYTGSDLDFEQTRHALGGEALAAWRPGRGHWHLEVGAGYYPVVFATADAPGKPFGESNMLDAHALLGYEVLPGLRVGLGGGLERWSGTGSDQAVRLSLGMHYTPGGVPKGNE